MRLILLAAVAGATYIWAALGIRGWPLRRTAAFLAGIGCVLVALDSRIDAEDLRSLPDHMIQHLLLLDVAPLLLLGGAPVLLALRRLPRAGRRTVARGLARSRPLTRPTVCLLTYSVIVLGTHIPRVFDTVDRQPLLHEAEHAVYLVAGLMLWWPLHDADPSPRHRLGGLGRLIYALAAMVPVDIVGAWLNRAPTVVYSAYAHTPQPVIDQQQAGAIMWVGGSVIMVGVGIWAAIGALVAEERRQRARDARLAT